MDSTHAMNEISSHSKLKVQLLLRPGVTSAGSTLSALLEVDSKAEFELGLGTMIVELVGTEGESLEKRRRAREGGRKQGVSLRRNRRVGGRRRASLGAEGSGEEDFPVWRGSGAFRETVGARNGFKNLPTASSKRIKSISSSSHSLSSPLFL